MVAVTDLSWNAHLPGRLLRLPGCWQSLGASEFAMTGIGLVSTPSDEIGSVRSGVELPSLNLYRSNPPSPPSPIVDADDRLRREDLILSAIPRIAFRNVLHLGCTDGSLTMRLPGAAVLGIDLKEGLSASRREINDRVALAVTDMMSLDQAALGCFDLVVVTDALDEDAVGQTFSLTWVMISRLIARDGYIIYDRVAKKGPTLPARRIDHFLYQLGDRLHLLELYKI